MMQLTVVVPLVFLILSNNLVTCRRRTQPSNNFIDVERPLVEALSPRGLRVSLPHVNGMELFAFHGKVNSPIRRSEQGNLDKDILFPTNGRWVFEDHEVQLRIGDVINYWIFVQVNSMGYRLDNLSTIIREFVHQDISSVSTTSRPFSYSPTISTNSDFSPNDHYSTTLRTTTRNVCNCNCNAEQYATITAQLNVTLDQLQILHDKMAPLYAQIESLTESLHEVIKDMNIGTQLLLTGDEPPGTNALEAVRELITEKLGLLDLDQNIRQAYRTAEGILFEMSSPMDKKRIIFRANKRLKNSGYKIEDPQSTSNSVGFSSQGNNYNTERTQYRPSANNPEPGSDRRTPSPSQRPIFDVRSTIATLIQDPYYSQRREATRGNLSMQRYKDSTAQSVENQVRLFSNIQAESQESALSNTRTILFPQQQASPALTIVQSTVGAPIRDPDFTLNQNRTIEIQQDDDVRIQEVPTNIRQKIQSSTRGVSPIRRAQSADNRRTSSERRLNGFKNPQPRSTQLSASNILV